MKKKKIRVESPTARASKVDENRVEDDLRYSNFEVQNFRCIRNLTVDPMERVNLIAGENNAGKTALLEALFLHSGAFNPQLVMSVAGLRGIGTYRFENGRLIQPPWSSLFANLDESLQIRIAGRGTRTRTRTLILKTTSDPQDLAHVKSVSTNVVKNGQGATSAGGRADVLKWHHSGNGRQDIALLFFDGPEIKTYPQTVLAPPFFGRFISSRWTPDFVEIAEHFGELEVDRKEGVLLNILRLIEPKLSRLSTVLLGAGPMLHADVGIGRLIPIAFLGDGILRLTRIILWIIHTAGGVLFLDEVDNGFHYSHLRQIWSAIAASARQFDVQIFATTHSRECIVAAHQAFGETFVYDFRLHRLERSDSEIRAITYDQEALEAAIDSDFEVR